MSDNEQPSAGSDQPATFRDLVNQAKLGDRDAIGRLIDQYRPYLLLVANEEMDRDLHRKLGPSDLVQQSMLAAQAKFDQFRGQTELEFKAWIRQILHNDLLDVRRRFKVYQRRNLRRERSLADEGAPTEIIDRLNTPGTDAVIKEQATMLRRAMDELPENYQQVLQLRNWDEMSFEQIGQQLDCSADAARKLWYRAVIKLQEVVKLQYPDISLSSINPKQ